MNWSWLTSAEGAESFGSVDDAVISAAEARIGRLPPEYRDFVRECGAARIGHRDVFGLHPLLPSHLDVVKETTYERATPNRALPPDLIAVFNDGAGNLHCVRAVSQEGSSVPRDAVMAWWRDDESAPELIANSFATWLRSLLPDNPT